MMIRFLLLIGISLHASGAFVPPTSTRLTVPTKENLVSRNPTVARPFFSPRVSTIDSAKNRGALRLAFDDERLQQLSRPFQKDENEDESEGHPYYDVIVVGSGNGACAFLQQCLNNSKKPDLKVLVLEQGQKFFFTSDVTHENGWSKTYSTGSIFRLHNAATPSGKFVLAGRACTMGGGGSINYTMMHESNEWLVKHLGRTVEYWKELKENLNESFKRPDPFKIETEFCKYIQKKANHVGGYNKANATHLTGNIPSYQDDIDKQLYIFPTQFNQHGQRTNSGVSLVDWRDERVDIRVKRKVEKLIFSSEEGISGDDSTCVGVQVKNTKTNEDEVYNLNPDGGKVVLCSGAESPRLLMKSKEGKFRDNDSLGKHVNDHICMPLGIYIVPKNMTSKVGPTDNYESLFAMSKLEAGKDNGEPVVCNIDFFTGSFDRLIYLVSSLYLTYLPLNGFKKFMGRNPVVFTILSNTIRYLLSVIVFIGKVVFGIWDLIRFQPLGTSSLPRITTSLVKFNAAQEGKYKSGYKDPIELGFFEDEQDILAAQEAIKTNLEMLESMGAKPFFLLRWIFQLITKIPYTEGQVNRYVRHFSTKAILSEQHMAGGCLFGEVIDKGLDDAAQTGKVMGSTNIHVADLSAVPLPRVSTQMTAYLVGHYVGSQLYPSSSNEEED